MMKTIVHQFYCICKSSDLRSVVHAVQVPARCRRWMEVVRQALVVLEHQLKDLVPISVLHSLGPSGVCCPRSRSSVW